MAHDAQMVREHVDRIQKAEGAIAQLRSDMATITVRQNSVWKDLYGGDGQKGVRDTLIEFVTAFNTREEERKAALETHETAVKAALDAHNSKMAFRFNLLTIVVAALMLLIAILTFVVVRDSAQKEVLKVPGISQQVQPQQSANNFAY